MSTAITASVPQERKLFEKAQEILRLLEPLSDAEKVSTLEIAASLRQCQFSTAVQAYLKSRPKHDSASALP